MRNWAKIDKFYIVFFILLIGLSILMVFTFKGTFDAILTSAEVEQSKDTTDLKVDRNELDEGYKFVFERESLPLKIR